nr:xylulose kinase-1 [Tanacetum cinerariifolium]
MVAYLNKSDASEGFNEVIDFLNGSYINYALTVNPTIYVTCIKQFWNTVAVKQSNDVTRLQALVDRKKVVITEAAIRDILRLDDAEGVDCLPNEEIFAELARMGYENCPQNLHSIRLSSRRVGKGFLGVEMPLFEGMLVAGEPEEQGDAEEVKKVERANKVKGLKLRRLKKVGTSQRIKSSDDTDMEDASNQGRMIDELDRDTCVALMDDEGAEKKEEDAQDPEEESTTIIPDETKSKDKGKGIMVEEPKPIKKRQQVEMDEEYARKLHEELNKDIDWNVAIDHVKQKAKEDSYVQRYQHLEIMPDEDDDVYAEATPLARKVHVVDYQIIQLKNKPRYKIIRADGTHQLGKKIPTLEVYIRSNVKYSEAESGRANAAKQKLMLLDSAAERRLMLLSQDKTVNDKCYC